MPQNKSVLFIIQSLESGGAERVASILLNEWEKNNHNITLVTYDDSKSDFYQIPRRINRLILGVNKNSRNLFEAIIFNVTRIIKLRRLIKQSEADILISFLTTTNIILIISSFGLNKRVVISERNDLQNEPLPKIWKLLRLLLYKYADTVTANSRVSVEQMMQFVPQKKLIFTPNPVYTTKSISNFERQPIILNVGRLTHQKNQRELIEAFEYVSRDNISWSLDIVGVGSLKDELKKLTITKGISEKIRFLGLVSDVNKYYQRSSIFILTSLHEGTPNVLLEAMSNELACIAPDSVPGITDIIQNGVNGLLYRGRDVRDLASKIATLINNPTLREDLGTKAKASLSRYTAEKVMDVWDSILK